jgi:hypothetical protein
VLVCRRCNGKGCADCGPVRRAALTEHYTAMITAWMRANGVETIAMTVIASGVAQTSLLNRQRHLAHRDGLDAKYLSIPAGGGRRAVVTTVPEALRSPYQLVPLDQVEAELGQRFQGMPADQRRVTSSTEWAMSHKPKISDSPAGAGAGPAEKRYDQLAAYPSVSLAIAVAKERGHYQGPMAPPEATWTEAHVIRVPSQAELERYLVDIDAGLGGRREREVA